MGTSVYVLAVVALLGLASCPHQVAAHGSLYVPRARNWVSPIPQGASPAPWYTFPANQNGVENFGNGHGPEVRLPANGPGVCGDPWQHYATNYAGMSGLSIAATYRQGQDIDVQWIIAANHGGRIGLKLCPNGRSGLTQACFDAYPLERSDGRGRHYWILEGDAPQGQLAGWLGIRGGRYRLPAGVSCANGCVLQWEYQTTNSCFPSDVASCQDCTGQGRSYARRENPVLKWLSTTLPVCTRGNGEIFYNCADIIITPTTGGCTTNCPAPNSCQTGGGCNTATRTCNPISNRPDGTACSGGTCRGGVCQTTNPPTGDPCAAFAPGPSRASCFCSRNPPGYYTDRWRSCTGGFWCFTGGSQYFQCASGTLFDAAIAACNWANLVSCPAPAASASVSAASAASVDAVAATAAQPAGVVDGITAPDAAVVASTAAPVEGVAPAEVVPASVAEPTAPVVDAASVASVAPAPVVTEAGAVVPPADAATVVAP